jgi:hypothetical protein
MSKMTLESVALNKNISDMGFWITNADPTIAMAVTMTC